MELEVLVRGKAGKEVEYGNKFFLSESVHGYVFDFNLIKGNLDDRDLLKESLQKMEEGKLRLPPNSNQRNRFLRGSLMLSIGLS